MANRRSRSEPTESKQGSTAKSSSDPPRGPEQANALVTAQSREASAVRLRFAERHSAIMGGADDLYSRLPLLELLGSYTSLGEEIRRQCDDLIVLCRSRGATWAQIALPLRVSRQAAQQAFTARIEHSGQEDGSEPPIRP